MTTDTNNTSRWMNALWYPAVLLILVQVASGVRDIPQMSFFTIYLQETIGLQPAAISSVIAGAQVAGMLTALLGGAIAARLGSKWVLVSGLVLAGLSSFVYQVHSPLLVAALWLMSGAATALLAIGGASYLTQAGASRGLGMLAAFYALSATAGGAVGNPLAGLLIERAGFQAYSFGLMGLSMVVILTVILWMPQFPDRSSAPFSLRSFLDGILATTRQPNAGRLVSMRAMPTIYYGMLTVLIPLLINQLTGSKVTVAVYGTTNLVVASLAQLLAGRAADRWGARLPSSMGYALMAVSGIGLALSNGTLWGLFGFGVLGIAAAWSLSTMMYIWVNDGVDKTRHPATFGFLHAIWSISMITGSLVGGMFVGSLPGLPFLIGASLNLAAIFVVRGYYAQVQRAPGAP